MGWRDDAKQVTGIGNPAASIAVETDIAKQLIEAQKTTPDALGQFFDRQKGRTTQNLLGEMQSVNTGNPLTDQQIRETMLKDRGMGLYDMEKLNKAMPLMEKTGKANYLTDVTVRDKLLSESHKEIDRDQLFKIGQHKPGTSDYEKALAESTQYNIQHNVTAPGVTNLATQSFNNKDVQFAPITNPNGEVVGNTVTNAVGDVANPKAWNTNAYRAAEKVAVKNMARDNPYIRDHSVFKAKFKNMVENHPEYGQKFKLGMADEAGMTLDTQTLEKFTTKISEGVNDRDPLTGEQTVNGRKTVVSNLNNLLSYMNINNIKDAKFDDLVIRTLERDPLTATEIFQKAGIAEPEKEEVINTNFQAKAKKYVREYYRRTHPELTDSILTKAYDRIINSGSDNISVAVGIGKRNAERRTEIREFQAKSKFEVYKTQLTNLNDIKKRGLVPHVTDNLFQQFKTKFPDAEMRPEDDQRLKDQVGGLLDRLKTHIGKNLKGEEKNAFYLTARRMIMEHGTWDQHTKWFGFRWPTWAGFGADFDVLKKGGKMNDQNKLAVIQLFHDSIADSNTIAKATGSDPKIKQGAEMLEKKLSDKITTLGGAVQARKAELTAKEKLLPENQSKNLYNYSPLAVLENFIPTPPQ